MAGFVDDLRGLEELVVHAFHDVHELIAMVRDVVRELVRHGVRKVCAIVGHYENQWIVTEGIDLAESYAYSDSESDLPMLRAVGHPVAVNPDTELARVAREEGWEVLRVDRLGRRLRVGAAARAAAAVGGLGTKAVQRVRA